MSSYPFAKWLRQLWHPSSKELLLYLEDELPVTSRQQVERHLESCWSCKLQHQEIERSMIALMKRRRASLAARSDLPPAACRKFATRISEVTAETRQFPIGDLRRRLLVESSWPRRIAAGALPGVVTLSLVLLWNWLNSVPPVSAEELLRKADQAEKQSVLRIAEPVVYQRIKVRGTNQMPLRNSLVTWEIWNDTKHDRFLQRVEDEQGVRIVPSSDEPQGGAAHLASGASGPSVVADLQRVLRSNHMDIRRPLSSASYEGWRQQLSQKSERIVETKLPDGSKGITLETSSKGPLGNDAIINAELTVRAKDWHPVTQYLKFQGVTRIERFELEEADFQVVAFSALPPSIVADFTTPTPSPRVDLRNETAGVESSFVPNTTPALSLEIQVCYALHRLRACLGEPIEIARRPDGGVQVRGIVKSPERKQELLAELGVVPHTRVKLRTMDEAAQEVLSKKGPPLQVESEEAAEDNRGKEAQSVRFPLQDDLERYLRDTVQVVGPADLQEKVNAFANQAFALSQSGLAEAWALRRLAEAYPPQKTSRLDQPTQWLLENMVRDHVAELRAAISRYGELLEPFLVSIGTTGAPVSSLDPNQVTPGCSSQEGCWPDFSLGLFHCVEKTDRLILGLLMGAEMESARSQNAASDLGLLLLQLDDRVRRLESEIAREFSVSPNTVSKKNTAH